MKLSFFSNRRVEITLACEKYRLAHRSSSCFDEGGSQAIGTLIQRDHRRDRVPHRRIPLQDLNNTVAKTKNCNSSKRPLEEESRCHFVLRIFLSNDNMRYLSRPTCRNQCRHSFHLQLNPKHMKIFSPHIGSDAANLIHDAIDSNIKNFSIRNLMNKKFNLNVSTAQIRQLRNDTINERIHDINQSPYGSSADKLIKLFETFHDVSFVYVMHNFSSGFVTHRKHKKKDYDPPIDNQEDIVGVDKDFHGFNLLQV